MAKETQQEFRERYEREQREAGLEVPEVTLEAPPAEPSPPPPVKSPEQEVYESRVRWEQELREAGLAVPVPVSPPKLEPPPEPAAKPPARDPDKRAFDRAVRTGAIPKGSQFVAGLDIDWSGSGLSRAEIAEQEAGITERTGRLVNRWGYYAPEQVAEIAKAEAEAKEGYEAKVRVVRIAEKAVEAGQAEIKTVLDKLASVTDAEGNINVVEAFATGLGGAIYEAKALGIFPETGVLDGKEVPLEEVIVAAQITVPRAARELADFEIALEADDPELFAIYQARGAEGYNQHIEDNYTKLPDGQYIDNVQLSEIRNTSLKIYEALMSSGMAAADKIVSDQQDATRQLAEYKIAIPPELPVGIDAVTGAPAKFGYDIPKYLRESNYDTATLITAGFEPAIVTKVSAALKATKNFWVGDKFNAYGAVIGGVETEHLEILTGSTAAEIKGLPVPFAQFMAEYELVNPIVLEATKATEKAFELEFKTNELRMKATEAFDEIYGEGAAVKSMGIELAQFVFVPAKVLEPRIELGDIKWWEWALGGVQLAAITAPLWIPPAVRGVKWVFPKLKIGTYPFSEPAISRTQLQRTRMIGTKTITASEVGMNETQFARFIKFRITHPGTTPFHFKSMEAFNTEALVREATRLARAGQRIPEKVSGLTPAQMAEQARILRNATNDSWGGLWSAFDRRVALQRLAAVTAKQPLTASQIVAQAAKNEAMWRAMAAASIARVQPTGFYIPDYPFVIPLAISDLRISTNQLAGIEPLTLAQIQSIAKAANITEAQVMAAAKAGTLTTTLAKPATVAKILATTQGLTAAQVETLTNALTKTQSLTLANVKSLTEAETLALAKVLTKAQVSEALAIEVAEAIAQIAKVMPAEATLAATKAMTKALVEGKTLAQAKVAAKIAAQTVVKTIVPAKPVTTIPVTPVTPVTLLTTLTITPHFPFIKPLVWFDEEPKKKEKKKKKLPLEPKPIFRKIVQVKPALAVYMPRPLSEIVATTKEVPTIFGARRETIVTKRFKLKIGAKRVSSALDRYYLRHKLPEPELGARL